MSRKIKLAAGFIGFATLASTLAPAFAGDGDDGKRHGMRGGHKGHIAERFQKADADSDGAITFEEFSAAMQGPLSNADGDSDGTITVEEAVAAMQQRQEERMRRRAERMINRFDSNNDGSLSVEEVNASQERFFARLDRDNNGEIEKDEMRMGRKGYHKGAMKGHHGDGKRGMMNDDAPEATSDQPETEASDQDE